MKTIGKKTPESKQSHQDLGLDIVLNKTMHLMEKRPSGLCECGLEEESVEHVICGCQKYKTKRKVKE